MDRIEPRPENFGPCRYLSPLKYTNYTHVWWLLEHKRLNALRLDISSRWYYILCEKQNNNGGQNITFSISKTGPRTTEKFLERKHAKIIKHPLYLPGLACWNDRTKDLLIVARYKRVKSAIWKRAVKLKWVVILEKNLHISTFTVSRSFKKHFSSKFFHICFHLCEIFRIWYTLCFLRKHCGTLFRSSRIFSLLLLWGF